MQQGSESDAHKVCFRKIFFVMDHNSEGLPQHNQGGRSPPLDLITGLIEGDADLWNFVHFTTSTRSNRIVA